MERAREGEGGGASERASERRLGRLGSVTVVSPADGGPVKHWVSFLWPPQFNTEGTAMFVCWMFRGTKHEIQVHELREEKKKKRQKIKERILAQENLRVC